MIYLASLLGYGDCLITLSLLERAPNQSAVTLIGTTITESVLRVMGEPVSLTEVLFGDLAAFYAIRRRGVKAAVRDIVHFRQWAASRLAAQDILILESSLPQNRLLVRRDSCQVLQVPRDRGAYEDRERAMRAYLGELPFVPCAKPKGAAKRVLINPSARAKSRNLSIDVLRTILQVAADVGTEVCLIDVDGNYEMLKSSVREYILSPSLSFAAGKLNEADAYIGPDSFFMHLAYYFRVPFLAFFWPSNMYFSPPGMLDQSNYVLYPKAKNKTELSRKVMTLLNPGAAAAA